MRSFVRTVSLSLVLVAALACSAAADTPPACPNQGQGMGQGPGSGMGERPMGPPPESIEACQGKSENQACSFTSPRGTVEGLCLAPRGQLHCVPKDAPGRGGMGRGQGRGNNQSQ